MSKETTRRIARIAEIQDEMADEKGKFGILSFALRVWQEADGERECCKKIREEEREIVLGNVKRILEARHAMRKIKDYMKENNITIKFD